MFSAFEAIRLRCVALQRLACSLAPAALLARWPRGWGLAALCSGESGRHGRWSIFARPRQRLSELQAQERLARPLSTHTCNDASPPFTGGLIGAIAYDFGATFEPRVGPSPEGGPGGPRMVWFDCPDALVFDHARETWWRVGEAEWPEPGPHEPGQWVAGGLKSLTRRTGYEIGVARALEYIRAGDVYQVNLAHRLCAAFAGDPRALFQAMLSHARPWYGAYLEWQDAGVERRLLSQSPELFLEVDGPGGTIQTRPMKGPRRPGEHRALEASPKDRAELAMIVDLMRNDLGRICRLGSVQVLAPRELEQHGQGAGAILQATATVQGSLPAGCSGWEILRATFPGGSVTGAPKIRAMQIINELEPESRGFYCGAIGFVSNSGHMTFNVAIRTALVTGEPTPEGVRGTVSYSVGAGIVADSEPAQEWDETMNKAASFAHVLASESEQTP